MKKTNTLFNETIYIMFKCVIHLHGHRNKVMPVMKPSILATIVFYTIANLKFHHKLKYHLSNILI
jgi:hypothetical protein